MTRNFTGMGNRDYVKPPRPGRILSPEERPVSLTALQGGAESFTKRGMFDMVLRTKEVRFLLEIVEAAKQYDLAWETYTSIEDKQYAIDAWNAFIDRQNDLRTLIWGGQEAFEAALNNEPKSDSTHGTRAAMSLEKLQRFRDAAKPYKVRLPWNDFANLIAVAEAAEAIESMLEGHPEEDSWPVTRVGPLMAAVSRLKRANT